MSDNISAYLPDIYSAVFIFPPINNPILAIKAKLATCLFNCIS